jgi:uncharacterized RDD family membrane protein YckC
MNYSYAGLGARALAFALDYLIIAGYLVLVAAVGAVANMAFPNLLRTLFGNRAAAQATGFLFVTLPVMLYFAVLESSSWQATWGKRIRGLRVVGADGGRISLARALGRTALKFIPWELSHTLIWQIRFAPAESSMLITAGFILIWLLIGANVVSLVMRTTHQTLYDQLAGTYVVATNDG